MRKYFTLFFSLVFYVVAFADNIYGFEGSGTQDDPYQIDSSDDFTILATTITAENTGAGEYFILTADIDFGGTEETPVLLPSIAKSGIDKNISNVNWGFQGVLDGNGKKISGIYHNVFDNSLEGQFNSLISSLGDGGVIKNLIFTTDNYIKSYNYVAPFVSVNKGGSINNCTNNADIIAVNMSAAGICGIICGGKGSITDCHNTGDITAMSYASGIIAFVQTGSSIGATDEAYVDVVVDNCSNTGDCLATSGTGAAGIAGSFAGALTNCTNSGNIECYKINGGGIIAVMPYVVRVTDNSNSGSVTGGDYLGGIIGRINNKGGEESIDISSNVNTGNIIATGTNYGDLLGFSARTAPVITDLYSVEADIDYSNAPCYNLMGQRVSPSAKGIVLRNGKKFINK